MKLFQLLPILGFLVSGVHGVFTPANKAELKAAVGTCTSGYTYEGANAIEVYTCTGGCLGETANGTCPIFAASNANGYPYGNISSWDVSKVTNMQAMFALADAFDQDLSSWNVSQVTNMERMFVIADAFNADISSWDVSQVTNMQAMFALADAFNADISSWDVSKVTDMKLMFQLADAFDQDLSSWNVSQVTNMEKMFYDADTFDQDIGNWDVSSVTNMENMFNDADAFDQCLSAWNVDSVRTSTNMFQSSGLQPVNYPCSTKWVALKTRRHHPTEVRGDTSCSLCNQTGHYGTYDSTPCIACPVGYFQTNGYQNYCSACAWGKWSDVTGASSNVDCIDMETVVANRLANSLTCGTLKDEFKRKCPCHS